MNGESESKESKGIAWQATFEDLGRHLSQTTFVVVDLETTGGSPGLNAIDRKSTRLNSSHVSESRMPSSA